MALDAHQAEDAILMDPLSVRANTVEVAEFTAALGLKLTPGSVPLTFPIRWLALPAVREAMEKAIGTPYTMHASQSFRYSSSIEMDREYSFRVTMRQKRAPPSRFIVHGTLCGQDNRIVLELETVLFPAKANSAAMMQHKFEIRKSLLPEIEIGPIDIVHVERYATAAHDHNRLHCDPDFARSVGLAGPIVHGMIIMGLFQEALSQWCGGAPISYLFGLFVRPVLIGSRLVIGGRILSHPAPNAREGQIVRLFVRPERHQIACIGEASINLDPSSGLSTT